MVDKMLQECHRFKWLEGQYMARLEGVPRVEKEEGEFYLVTCTRKFLCFCLFLMTSTGVIAREDRTQAGIWRVVEGGRLQFR